MTQRPSSELAAILLQLELEGKIIGWQVKKYSPVILSPSRIFEIISASFLVTDYQQGYTQLSIRKQNQAFVNKNAKSFDIVKLDNFETSENV